MTFDDIISGLLTDLEPLRFSEPVTHVYNPLIYARSAHDLYIRRYGWGPKEVILLGMNPGPWGMAQTGVPFGEVEAVKNWLRIQAPVDQPAVIHPKRPIEGFSCRRSEVSGRRLWGWARETFGTPEKFFSRFFVANYCPLIFMEESGRNRTPNTIPVGQRRPLLAACDQALKHLVDLLDPRYVIGIGAFAADRARTALNGTGVSVGKITHPSPANPRANRGWQQLVEAEFNAMGIRW